MLDAEIQAQIKRGMELNTIYRIFKLIAVKMNEFRRERKHIVRTCEFYKTIDFD